MGAGRECGLCRLRMRPELRHLHELEEGILFRLPDQDDLFEILSATPSSTTVHPLRAPGKQEVAFETLEGREVAFQATRGRARRMAPNTEVLPRLEP